MEEKTLDWAKVNPILDRVTYTYISPKLHSGLVAILREITEKLRTGLLNVTSGVS